MTDKMPMTAQGYEKLEAELKHLRSVERPAVIKAIAEAREHGDLSENAEYHAARERQSFIEGRVAELEDAISRSQIIDPKSITGKSIKFGELEADVKAGKVAVTSPIARALIGKEQGDSIEVITPKGTKAYEILKVQFK